MVDPEFRNLAAAITELQNGGHLQEAVRMTDRERAIKAIRRGAAFEEVRAEATKINRDFARLA